MIILSLEDYIKLQEDLRNYSPLSIIAFLEARYVPLLKPLPLSEEENNNNLIISKIMEEEIKTAPETPGEWTPPEEPEAPAEEPKEEVDESV